jgi:hypothetical protein
MGVDALIEQLQTIPDWRRGNREVDYPLWLMLLMTLLGVMSGYTSLRGLADFMKRHGQEAATIFGLKKAKLASYSTLRRMVHRVDVAQVSTIFRHWAKQAFSVPAGAGVAIDGKALASTVQNSSTAEQDFVSVVSACVQSCGIVIDQVSFHNGVTSEITSVRELLKQLDVKGVWLTLDALHAQKKR